VNKGRKRTAKLFFSLFILGFVFIFSLTQFPLKAFALSGVPTVISYQGRLTNSSGDLLGGSGTTYYFKFSIYDSSSGGTKLWPLTSDPTQVAATVRQGVFNVNVGDVNNGYPDVLDFNFNTNRVIYLQVEVSSTSGGTFQALTPRQLIAGSAFAQLAGAVSGTSTPSIFGSTTPIGLSQITVEATTSSSIGVTIRSALSQSANLFQIQESLDGINRVIVDSGFRFGLGTTSIGGDLGAFGFAAEGAALIGNYLTTSYVTATSTTATSTFEVVR